MELAPGRRVTPEITLIRPIGAGAIGSVWMAKHSRLQEPVAIKLLSAKMLRDRASLSRFNREAEAAMQIQHPNVLRIYEHGTTEGGYPYILMELLSGETLGARLARVSRLSVSNAAIIVRQVASALDAAHARGIIHRDIKPDNLFLLGGRERPEVKVLDFGMAKQVRKREQSIVTATGVAVGTPEYMSPEQVLGAKDVDFRCDLWALGVVCYRMLTGRPPFSAETPHALFFTICKGEFTPLDDVGAPIELEPWFRRALQPAKEKRFGSALEMAMRFEEVMASIDEPRFASDGDEEIDTYRPPAPAEPIEEEPITYRPPPQVTVDDEPSTVRPAHLSQPRMPAENDFARTVDLPAEEDDSEEYIPTREVSAKDAAAMIAAAVATHGDPMKGEDADEAVADDPSEFESTLTDESEEEDPFADVRSMMRERRRQKHTPTQALPDFAILTAKPAPEADTERLQAKTEPVAEGGEAAPPVAAAPASVDDRAASETAPASQVAVARDALRPAGNGKLIGAVAVLAVVAAAGAFVVLRGPATGETATSQDPPVVTGAAPAASPTSAAQSQGPTSTAAAASPVVDVDLDEPGKLSIVCEPACSEVRVGDQSFGPSPIFDRELPPGLHQVALFRPGSLSQVISVEVKPGEKLTKQINLLPAALASAAPPGAAPPGTAAPSAAPPASAAPPSPATAASAGPPPPPATATAAAPPASTAPPAAPPPAGPPPAAPPPDGPPAAPPPKEGAPPAQPPDPSF